MKFRKEFDSIGKINVQNDKYWGASTERSKKFFDIGEVYVQKILIKSIAIIKKAAAIFIATIAFIKVLLTNISPISKYFLDLSVDAPQYLSSETFMDPILSISFLNFIWIICFILYIKNEKNHIGEK